MTLCNRTGMVNESQLLPIQILFQYAARLVERDATDIWSLVGLTPDDGIACNCWHMLVDNASEEMGCAIWSLMGPTPHGIAPLCPPGGLQMPFHLRIIAVYFVIQGMYQNLMLNILPRIVVNYLANFKLFLLHCNKTKEQGLIIPRKFCFMERQGKWM